MQFHSLTGLRHAENFAFYSLLKRSIVTSISKIIERLRFNKLSSKISCLVF